MNKALCGSSFVSWIQVTNMKRKRNGAASGDGDISVSILPKNFYVAERLRKARPKVFVKILTHSKSDKSARFLKTSFVQLHAIMGLQSGKGARTSETTSVGAVMDSIELP